MSFSRSASTRFLRPALPLSFRPLHRQPDRLHLPPPLFGDAEKQESQAPRSRPAPYRPHHFHIRGILTARTRSEAFVYLGKGQSAGLPDGSRITLIDLAEERYPDGRPKSWESMVPHRRRSGHGLQDRFRRRFRHPGQIRLRRPRPRLRRPQSARGSSRPLAPARVLPSRVPPRQPRARPFFRPKAQKQ